MSAGRIVIAVFGALLALALAVLVPLAQLPSAPDTVECCCPDPATCKCPDHQPDHSPDPTLRACHGQPWDLVPPQLPAFVAPTAPTPSTPSRLAALVSETLVEPHAQPAPRRPDAPS